MGGEHSPRTTEGCASAPLGAYAGRRREGQGVKRSLGEDAELVEAAAWLHDIGYAPDLHDTGFHPLDGARYLRDVEGAEPLLCRMVAHHSCALIEAEERGLAAELVREFRPPPRDLAEALIYCDMTTGPDGQPVDCPRSAGGDPAAVRSWRCGHAGDRAVCAYVWKRPCGAWKPRLARSGEPAEVSALSRAAGRLS